MFYSPVYLKKSGRFGLIWIAATHTKILSRREIATVNISSICSDIFCHIPGLREKGSRASRFSLYLCCQLMYGSVKVLQKQWDILLVDFQTLCKKCTDSPSSTKDIDMAMSRQAVCIESKIPSNAKDVNFDPYFGAVKEAAIDVASMLDYLESLSQSKMLVTEPFPLPVQPEIGSPHSVVDPKEIQIRDVAEIAPITAQLPMEQDLPRMDIDSFLLLSQDGSLQEIQAQLDASQSADERHDYSLQAGNVQEQRMGPDGILETEDPNISMMREILMDVLPQTDILREKRSPLEETPLTKPTSGMPPPPHKPHLDRPKRPRDASRKGSRFQDICNEAELQANTETNAVPVGEQTSSGDSLRPEHQPNQDQMETDERGHGHDWAQKNPPILDLHPVSPISSPLRKKRPHKLVIDECLMISRPELRTHMENTSDIVMKLQLSDTTGTRNSYKEPGLKYMRNKALIDLFTKNCKFGLRMDDTGSEPDSVTSPQLADFQSRKRARREAIDLDEETPAKKNSQRASEVASMEKARVSQALSASVEKNLSHSSLGQVADESAQHTRSSVRGHLSLPSDLEVSKDGSSILEQDVTLDLGVLATWPEEQELKISPIRRPGEKSANSSGKEQTVEEVQDTGTKTTVLQDATSMAAKTRITSPPVESGLNSNVMDGSDTPRTTVSKLVESNVRTSNDWTTFQSICPPTSCTKKIAASMFNALCAQIDRGKLCARQDEPYTSIFIWVPEFTSGLSTSIESH